MNEHIAHTDSGGCMKKLTIQLRFPVCAITSYASNFGYEQIQLVLYGLAEQRARNSVTYFKMLLNMLSFLSYSIKSIKILLPASKLYNNIFRNI